MHVRNRTAFSRTTFYRSTNREVVAHGTAGGCTARTIRHMKPTKYRASCTSHLVEAGPSRAALELGGRRVRREIAHGAVEGARPLGVVLDPVREPPGEGRFRAPADDVPLLDAQLSLLTKTIQVFRSGGGDGNNLYHRRRTRGGTV